MSLCMFRALNAHLEDDTLYTCRIWYCHSLREFVVTCRCTLCTDRSPWSVYRVTVLYAAFIQCIILKMSIQGIFRASNAHLQDDTLFTCRIWYCHSLREFVVTCRCTVCTERSPRSVYRVTVLYAAFIQLIILKMSIQGSKHADGHNILWIMY